MGDTGLLRKDESSEVKERLEKHIPGLKLKVIDASKDFYAKLAGVTEPERKRKIIGGLFIDCFEQAAKEMGLPLDGSTFLLQGTLYPDVIESTSFKGPSSVIKTHHNVGGLPDRMKMEVIEPLRLLFKDEVRALGRELGLPHKSNMRHPFPGPGLGIRIIGEVTTTDFMTADWFDMPHAVLAKISNRIINEVKGINRVCYDVSSKPPATIEWE